MPKLTPFLALPVLLVSAHAAAAQQTIEIAQPRAGDPCQGFAFEVTVSTMFGQHDFPRVTEVVPATPAERSGMRVGDLLVSRNGKSMMEIAPTSIPVPGDTIRFVVRRGQEELPIALIVGARQADETGRLVCAAPPARPEAADHR